MNCRMVVVRAMYGLSGWRWGRVKIIASRWAGEGL